MNNELVNSSSNYLENIQTPIFTKNKLQKLSKQLEVFHIQKRNFGKHHSVWMDKNLILSKVTPLRNARQALAHIERSYQAIKENEYKIKKQQIKLLMKKESLKTCNDPLKRTSPCRTHSSWSYNGRYTRILYLHDLHAEIPGEYSTSQQGTLYRINVLADGDICGYATSVWYVE